MADKLVEDRIKERTKNRIKMKKILFIDRDGTIIKETTDEKIDTFDKLVFYPKALSFLGKIARELEFDHVMITNQDGLRTDFFPEDTFWPIHKRVIDTFKKEGVVFKEEFIDKTYPHENAATRKPKTGLLQHYFTQEYDLNNSFVIGIG
jgi:imidazoleglycerol-phosphate dehydratase/histidinol-phosphatase